MPSSKADCTEIQLADAELIYYPAVFDEPESKKLFSVLKKTALWTSREVNIFGRKIPMPRLLAWYADSGVQYQYSGGSSIQNPWTPELLHIKKKVELLGNTSFNGALLNLYRNGQDSMSWHSDDETSLGKNPIIASVSFGAIRIFKMRHRHNKHIKKFSLPLENGSLLIMRGTTQHHWQHQIAKTRQATAARINITFRSIQHS